MRVSREASPLIPRPPDESAAGERPRHAKGTEEPAAAEALRALVRVAQACGPADLIQGSITGTDAVRTETEAIALACTP